MKSSWVLATLALLVLGSPAPDADARKKHGYGNHWEDNRENRRDARRAGIVVGAVASGVARSSGNARADRRYEECMQETAYQGYDPNTGYNSYGYGPAYQWCAEMRREDERSARRSGRRAGAVAGTIAYGAVRD